MSAVALTTLYCLGAMLILRLIYRPAWDAKTTPADLSRAEKDSFLEWRRNLAQLTDAQNFVLTPFERNIEVWRQLWRVLEQAHLVVQIVDARNPLKFRCEDLEKYVESLGVVSKSGLSYLTKEVEGDGDPAQAKGAGPRRNLLLINKADLLDEGQRRVWADYFEEHGIRYAFFSAANAAALQAAKAEAEELARQEEEDKERKQRQRARRQEAGEEVAEDEESEEEEAEESLADAAEAVTLGARDAKPLVGAEAAGKVEDARDSLAEQVQEEVQASSQGREDAVEAVQNTSAPVSTRKDATGKDSTRVLNVLELEELFMATAPPLTDFATDSRTTPTQLTVGLVGYPNVGKSSTINALLGSKKVSVSATPGKTKHFQTLRFSEQMTLCDCPGLVFPQFATSSGELIVDGILPIDQMREYTAPAELVAQRIPRDILEGYYGIRIQTLDVEEGGSGTPTGLEVLSAYAVARGFVRQGQGNPDESRAARYVLKDYVNAKLLYCNPPPAIDGEEFNAAQRKRAREALKGRRYDPALDQNSIDGVVGGAGAGATPTSKPGAKARALDAAFFAQGNQNGAQAKGRKGTPGKGVISGRVAADGSIIAPSSQQQAGIVGNGKKHHKGNKRGKIRYAGVHDD